MHLWLSSLITLTVVTFPTAAWADYASFTYRDDTQDWYAAWGLSSHNEAAAEVNTTCPPSRAHCVTHIWQNGIFVLAATPDGSAYAWGEDPRRKQAESMAQTACQTEASPEQTCQIVLVIDANRGIVYHLPFGN